MKSISKNKSLKTLFTCLMSALMFAALDLQAQTKTRVRFAKGKSSTTVSGKIARGQTKCLLLATREGQNLHAELSSPTKRVTFTEINGAMASNNDYLKNEATSGGDAEVCIKNRASATTFTLFISVD